ncbi:hypothetical protein MIMGU_mgv1a024847mg [Erythranthe guttata]|uniref:Scaffold protein Nfu/NifU N-terminal domain-containing protein n=1 Tax=Erythranthe guttata TaxID=4155 RepID=A0A022RCY6_ERYGU|nr:hypothetical protein MIMGU_mgv1a024847mg [Erythranthe guttata]
MKRIVEKRRSVVVGLSSSPRIGIQAIHFPYDKKFVSNSMHVKESKNLVVAVDFSKGESVSPKLRKQRALESGITRVFFGSDFVTVTKSEDTTWDFLKPEIFAAIMDFYSSGQPLILDSNSAASMDTAIKEDDSEVVAMIKELLETRIRPAVQDDGGDIEYVGFDPDSGIVKLRMQGACSGCPSSSVTLKSGIENMLMHYVPEVKSVEQEFDDEDENTALTGAPYE